MPIDFMSADAAHAVLTVSAPPSKRIRGTQAASFSAIDPLEKMEKVSIARWAMPVQKTRRGKDSDFS